MRAFVKGGRVVSAGAQNPAAFWSGVPHVHLTATLPLAPGTFRRGEKVGIILPAPVLFPLVQMLQAQEASGLWLVTLAWPQ